MLIGNQRRRSRSRTVVRSHRRCGWLWHRFSGQANGRPCLSFEHGRCGQGVSGNSTAGRSGRCGQWENRALTQIYRGPWLTFILSWGLSCSSKESPQAVFDHAYQTFVHGNLKESQDEAHRGCERFRNSNPEWAWKFRILEAKSLLWRGMYGEVLTLLSSAPNRPTLGDSRIEILALEGAADSRLHRFDEAQEKLVEAARMCQRSLELTCGDVTQATGVLASQHGKIEDAKQSFEQSLQFARAQHDPLLEGTALINLGVAALQKQHFDEAIDWADAAYQGSLSSGAGNISQTALGNLGWAYYNLGDPEKSLTFSLEAEKRAGQVGNAIGQLYWLTNAGYVYAGLNDLVHAKQSYVKALGLATEIGGKQGIYNALRALALVSVESGELNDARKYAADATAKPP